MKRQLLVLTSLIVIASLVLAACSTAVTQSPASEEPATPVIESPTPLPPGNVAILVLDDFVDEVFVDDFKSLSTFQWQEYDDKVTTLIDNQENCVYNLSGQAATISTGAAATISTGAGASPLPAPHGVITFEELRSVVRRAQDPNTGQLANTDEQTLDATAELGLDWIKSIVQFRDIGSGQTIVLLAVDVSDYETKAIVNRLSQTIDKLFEKGYERFVINMSFVIIPCSFFKDSQTVFNAIFDEYQKSPNNDPQLSYLKDNLISSTDQTSISFSIKDEIRILTKLATPDTSGNYFIDKDGNSITDQDAGVILGFNPVFGPVRLKSYYKQSFNSVNFEEVLKDPLRQYLIDLSQKYIVIPVASAGNQGLPYPYAPAMWDEVLSVSSPIDNRDANGLQVSNFTGNAGVAQFKTNSGEVVSEGCTNYSQQQRIPGTSFAAPKVSYLAALYLLRGGMVNSCLGQPGVTPIVAYPPGSKPITVLGYAQEDGTWANLTLKDAADQYCTDFPASVDLGTSCP